MMVNGWKNLYTALLCFGECSKKLVLKLGTIINFTQASCPRRGIIINIIYFLSRLGVLSPPLLREP